MSKLRRFHCIGCGLAVTPWLRELKLADAQARYESRTSLVPGGWFVHDDALQAGMWRAPARHPWLIAPLPGRWLRPHPDAGRSSGCCGMNFVPELPNLVCACGREVGFGYRDCCGPQWYALGEQLALGVIDDPAPPRGVAWGLARAQEIVDAAPVAGAPEAIGGHVDHRVSAPRKIGGWVDHEDPSTWSAAPRLGELRLSCSGGAEAPVLTIEAPELDGAALVVAVPWVVLMRFFALAERPWGDPAVPLSWQASVADAPIVHLSGHRKVVLMTIWGPGQQSSAVRFKAAAWAGAWARLRATL